MITPILIVPLSGKAGSWGRQSKDLIGSVNPTCFLLARRYATVKYKSGPTTRVEVEGAVAAGVIDVVGAEAALLGAMGRITSIDTGSVLPSAPGDTNRGVRFHAMWRLTSGALSALVDLG